MPSSELTQIDQEAMRRHEVKRLARKFGALRKDKLSEDEIYIFHEEFGSWGKNEAPVGNAPSLRWPTLDTLEGLIVQVCTEHRAAKLSDLIKSVGGSERIDWKTARRVKTREGFALCQRVTEDLITLYKGKGLVLPKVDLSRLAETPLRRYINIPGHFKIRGGTKALLDDVWFVFNRSGHRELIVVPYQKENWVVREHDPMEQGWSPPGMSIRWGSLIESCSSKNDKQLWNGFVDGNIKPIVEIRTSDDRARAHARVTGLLSQGQVTIEDL